MVTTTTSDIEPLPPQQSHPPQVPKALLERRANRNSRDTTSNRNRFPVVPHRGVPYQPAHTCITPTLHALPKFFIARKPLLYMIFSVDQETEGLEHLPEQNFSTLDILERRDFQE